MHEKFETIYKILTIIMAKPESEAFVAPVDWKNLMLFDYPEIVKTPMDLGTIKKNIENDKYETEEDVANDIRLVWTNCMLYNRDGSEFYHLAAAFSQAFEDTYSALCRLQVSKQSRSEKNGGNDAKEGMQRVPSLSERMQLSHDIYKLDSIELAALLTIIEQTSSHALSKRANQNEVLINIDALSPICYNQVNAFLLECFLSRTGGDSSHDKKKKRDGNNNNNSNNNNSASISDKKQKKVK